MAVRCCNCGYTMRTNQEIQSAIVKAFYDLKTWIFAIFGPVGITSGHLNTGPYAIKCPKCGEKGRFEDG